ncbi:hypothetical protein J1614_006528 [Plenodomus biglobosus]|nr:hypothetical protein J1614_006528 [Plenodomus biglobosus]
MKLTTIIIVSAHALAVTAEPQFCNKEGWGLPGKSFCPGPKAGTKTDKPIRYVYCCEPQHDPQLFPTFRGDCVLPRLPGPEQDAASESCLGTRGTVYCCL